MKRKELWELLGEVPADMIEEASVPRKGNRVLWLRRALPLAAAVLLLCATAVAAGKYFGWQDVLNAGPEQMTDYTEPLAVQVEYGSRSIPATRTTPDAVELQGLLAAIQGAGCDSAVMEVSSHALDQQRVACLRFAAAAFTNLSQDHLDYHGTMERYFETKKRLFDQLAQERPGAAAVCFRDAGYGERMAAHIATLPLRLVTCGFTAASDVRAEEVVLAPEDTRFTLVLPGGARLPLRVHLAGRYNVANMLCAAALALESGVSPDAVAAALQEARPR